MLPHAKYALIFCSLLLLAACRNEPSSDATSVMIYQLSIKAGQTSLRDAPGEAGTVLKELPKGTSLRDLGEVSDFLTRITTQGTEQYEPWLKVATADEEQGWVYAGAIEFGADTTLLHEKRFKALLGAKAYQQAKDWQATFKNISNQESLANAYTQGKVLRDSLVRTLENRVQFDGETPPDMFWLGHVVPGFVAQLVAEGTAYYLFEDYSHWQKIAAKTPQKEDDGFFQFCIQMFPEDSIEYFFPAWTIQTWDYGGCSLLGRSIHLKLLETANRLCTANTPFRSEILSRKAELINDMTQEGVEYWEQPEKIMRELDAILERNFEILTEADKIALRTRRTHFEAPSKHNLKTGMGSGSTN